MKLRGGERITFDEPETVSATPAAQDIPLNILYEDASLLVINKPSGLVIHPGAGNTDSTLVNALLHHCSDLSGIGGVDRPGIVHRLDKETSGCVVVAKNDRAHQNLTRQFAGREIWKIYLAWVEGVPRHKRGRIEAPVGRHPIYRKKMAVMREGSGREARTDYAVRSMVGGVSLLECRLFTGRTHQIRVHLKSVGHPVLGDSVYGKKGGHPRQMLHAWQLGFAHPETGEWTECVAPWPEDFGRWQPAPEGLLPGHFREQMGRNRPG
jgi:23S rRNA pseudouridine1911/1915/1917 synthase